MYVQCRRIIVLPALINAERYHGPGTDVGGLRGVGKVEGAAPAGEVGASDVVLGDCFVGSRREIQGLFDASGYVAGLDERW
jgi:hypothetical protein